MEQNNKIVKITDLKELKELPNNIVIEKYIPIKAKYVYGKRLVDEIIQQNENGIRFIDPVISKVVRTVGLISMYTNIELLEDDYENYDILSKNNLINLIQNEIGADYHAFDDIIMDLLYQEIEQYNSINNIVAKSTEEVLIILNRTMKHVDGMLDKGDPNKIAKYLSGAFGMIATKLPDLSKLDMTKILKGKE